MAPQPASPDDRAPDAASDGSDAEYMDAALDEARRAGEADEVPVGCVVVHAGEIVARAHNRTRERADPTAHAELLAVVAATRRLGRERLVGCTVYSTVEPCFMCAGALSHARVDRVVWGIRDPKFGGCASLGTVLSDPRSNHFARTCEGVRADESRALLQEFFRSKRASRPAGGPRDGASAAADPAGARTDPA